MSEKIVLKYIYISDIKQDAILFARVQIALGLSRDRTAKVVNANDERLTLPKIQNVIKKHLKLDRKVNLTELKAA